MKCTNSAAIAVLGLSLIGFLAYKGRPVPDAIGYVVGIYVLGRQAKKASDIIAIAKDPAADTLAALERQEK